jgi:hypothetical protein
LADTDRIVLVPVLLLFFATLCAAVMAYGTDAGWAQYSHGLSFILWSRRLEWPLVVISLILCIAMVGLIIAGKRRAWWLIGLAPVLALFLHRFTAAPSNRFHVVEDPAFVAAGDAKFVGADDWVVGYHFVDVDYALPYAALFDTPVVIHADHDRRVAVMWSAYANRAVATEITRELRGTDLEVVSTPANALLVYNARLGQFINGFTGLTTDWKRPEGFRDTVPTVKTTWKAWRASFPESKVLKTATTSDVRAPIVPTFPLPRAVDTDPADKQIALIGSPAFVAIASTSITAKPLNVSMDGVPVLVFRDPADTDVVRAFDRRVDDLRPKFRLNTNIKKHPKATFIDEDTNSGWDAKGVVVDGPQEMHGKRLKSVPVEDRLPLRVMKYWYPNLKVLPAEGSAAKPVS